MAEPDDFWAAMSPTLRGEGSFVLTTVISTSSSAPRPAGTQMAILDSGAVVGSLSGGCIEADVYAQAEDVAATGKPVVQDYGYTDEAAFSVGLTCGGSIRVYLEQIDPADFGFFRCLADRIQAGEPVATITALGEADGWRSVVGPSVNGRTADSSGGHPVPDIEGRASAMLQAHRSGIIAGSGTAEADLCEPESLAARAPMYFVRSYGRPAHMVVFGSNAFAAALVHMAKVVGYRVTVCDARKSFTTVERFPQADQIVVRWPHEYLAEREVDHRTVLCAMTHDPKFDEPLLVQALRSPAQFIGAMGSRQASEQRDQRLRALGLSEQELARLHAPFGLDLGASTPQETAISMLAEIISARQGGSNLPLGQSRGPIHHPDPFAAAVKESF